MVNLKAKTLYKKQAGLLELDASHIQWTREGESTPSFRDLLLEANALFCSKEGAAQVKLKLVLKNDEQGHNFVFTATNAHEERDRFKRELTTIIARNRARGANKQASDSSKPETAIQGSTTQTISLPQPSREPSLSRRGSLTPQASVLAPEDYRLCKKVLMKNPELADLHKELVMTGQISETEFWEGRQQLLKAEKANEEQIRGKPGTLVDPRPETLPNGETKIVITPQLMHEIFDEFAVVAQAHRDNVPSKLSESSFWQRYFQSKLFYSHQASIRSAAAQHVVKADPIFDRYLQRTDDGPQPLRVRQNVRDINIDLAATEEDHRESGNVQDVTMQAGRQKAVLPLIRRFNEHSERLLKTSLRDPSAIKAPSQGAQEDNRDNSVHIDLEDLHESMKVNDLPLHIHENQRLFDASQSIVGISMDRENTSQSLRMAKLSFADWSNRLSSLSLEKKASDFVVLEMTEEIQKKLAVQMDSVEMPVQLMAQLNSYQNAANELLRQFWFSLFPTPQDLKNPILMKLEQREAKAAKMVACLQSMEERAKSIIASAQQLHVDTIAVETAMKPVQSAIRHAFTVYQSRHP